jgi:hypothetical protein
VDSLRIVHTMTGEVPDIESRPADADREDAATRAKFNKLRSWLEHERDRQSENRAEMAIDADYYDGLQWTEDDAKEVESRGQAPLVYNEIKVSIDWILGAEKRNRVDWRVLPREEGDSDGANVRSKVLKFYSDVNRVQFIRSQAFAEAAISGLSWLEDSLSMDATDDPLYSGAESWRNVLHDSYHKRPDGKDMRYLFRWRYLDLDIAQALWPKHKEALERAAQGADQLAADADDELWYLGANMRDPQTHRSSSSRSLSSTGSSIDNDRRRVKIYEAWYREPEEAKVLYGGPFHGDIYQPGFAGHERNIESGACDAISAIVLRARVAYMTDAELLEDCDTPYAHNQFSLTPLYCFRRGRDGMPYGHVRQMRDPQMDLNKRMSKSLFLLSVNQLITERAAFSTEKDGYSLQDAIDNVANPQGVFVLERGDARFEIRRDFQEIRGHAEILALDRQFLQSSSGVNLEQLGRTSNVISGKGILAKQDSGALTTAGIFDNYRLAISVSGQKGLSNVEKFYTMPKVVRLTETQVGEQMPKITWEKINQPELQPDGSVRFINDITQSHADFIVDEQDYRASMRQAMFDQLLEMLKIVAPVAPAIAVGLLDIVVDANDFPGKETMVARIRQLIAEARGEAQTPEQKAAAAELEALQKRAAAAKIAVDESKADKTDAEADQLRLVMLSGVGDSNPDLAEGGQGAAAGRTMAPAGEPMPGDTPSMGQGAPAGAAQPQESGDDGQAMGAALDAITAVLEQNQQTQEMLKHQAAMAMQQGAQLQGSLAQMFQQTNQALQQLAAVIVEGQRAARQAPRTKTIRITDAEGRPITATIENHQ